MAATATTTEDESKKTLRRCLKYLAAGRKAEKRWRQRSLESLKVYFHEQWDPANKAVVEGRGQAAIRINRTRITINMMLGLHASQPLDPRMKPVGVDDDDLSDLGTAAVKDVWDREDIPSLGNAVYFWGLSYGYGVAYTGAWVRDRDRKTQPVQAMWLDGREVTIDPNCRRDDLTDCQWIDWRRTLDVEVAQGLYPKHSATLAKMAGKDPETGDSIPVAYTGPTDGTVPSPSRWKELEEWNLTEDVDTDNERVTLHEIWERRWESGTLITYRDGYVEEWSEAKHGPIDALLFDPKVLDVQEDVDVPRIYYHIVCGDQLLESQPSPYEHGQFPFVVLMNERDHNGDPIGEVEYLKDLQSEINHIRSKLIYELTNAQMWVSNEAMERNGGIEGIAEKAANANSVFYGTPEEVGYLNRVKDLGIYLQLLSQIEAEMQAVSGANDDLMGYNSSSKSGVAKDIVRQQGATLQKPRETKLLAFYKRLTWQLFALIQQYWTDERAVRLTDEVGKDRHLIINQREIDPLTGETRILNDINQARFEEAVDFEPWTPTVREKVGEVLKDLADKEPDPIARRALLVAAIQALPIPNKGAILDAYRQASQPQQTQMQPPDATVPVGAGGDLAAMAGAIPQVPISPYAPPVAA